MVIPLEAQTFETYEANTASQRTALGLSRDIANLAIEQFACSEPTKPAAFYFSGPAGVGKTHLLHSIAAVLIENEIPHARWQKDLGPSVAEQIKHVQLIDDFDPTLLYIFNRAVVDRYYPRGQLLVINSNEPLKVVKNGLKSIDEHGRAASRLSEMIKRGQEIKMTGPDHRQTGNFPKAIPK